MIKVIQSGTFKCNNIKYMFVKCILMKDIAYNEFTKKYQQ